MLQRLLITQVVHGTVQVTLSLKHDVKLVQESNETAHIPPEPDPSARHWQSELVEQDPWAPQFEGWHWEVTGISPTNES